MNVVTACILLRRALKAFEATEYDIGDATFTIYLAQLLSQRAERNLAWLDGVPKLPIADENETDWQVVKSDRATSRLIAHALRFAEDMGDSGVGCISAGDQNSEGYRAARILREKGWNAQMQDSLSPGMTPGLQISRSRKKDA